MQVQADIVNALSDRPALFAVVELVGIPSVQATSGKYSMSYFEKTSRLFSNVSLQILVELLQVREPRHLDKKQKPLYIILHSVMIDT